MLPPVNANGFLPEGIHRASAEAIAATFGKVTPRRQWLQSILREILDLAVATGKLERLFLFGSFVSNIPFPNDLDLLIVVAADFQTERLPQDSRILFDYMSARTRFNADVFWTKASIGAEGLALLLDTYQNARNFQRRGIVEVILP